ncbi:hypothetical protein FB451DRAFT_751717 [Mycena latifolia]|nr:hypothetical protein FB451DRAFT_751717 [Mycena latifolia]
MTAQRSAFSEARALSAALGQRQERRQGVGEIRVLDAACRWQRPVSWINYDRPLSKSGWLLPLITLDFVFVLSFVTRARQFPFLVGSGAKLKCGGVAGYSPLITRSMQLPFSLSYLIFTPRHVRLPGEVEQPIRDKSTSTPSRWPARLVAGTKSLRSFRSMRRLRGLASSPPEDLRHEPEL